jgi:hypothetical protein
LLAFTALGLYLVRRRLDPLAALAILVVLAISLLHGFVEVRDRYHSYAIPLLMPVAALAIVAVAAEVRSRRAGRSPPPSEPPDEVPPAAPDGPEPPRNGAATEARAAGDG